MYRSIILCIQLSKILSGKDATFLKESGLSKGIPRYGKNPAQAAPQIKERFFCGRKKNMGYHAELEQWWQQIQEESEVMTESDVLTQRDSVSEVVPTVAVGRPPRMYNGRTEFTSLEDGRKAVVVLVPEEYSKDPRGGSIRTLRLEYVRPFSTETRTLTFKPPVRVGEQGILCEAKETGAEGEITVLRPIKPSLFFGDDKQVKTILRGCRTVVSKAKRK